MRFLPLLAALLLAPPAFAQPSEALSPGAPPLTPALWAPHALYAEAAVGTRLSGRIDARSHYGNPLRYTVSKPPAHGRAEVKADGAWTYRPAANYIGRDHFEVTSDDGVQPQATRIVLHLNHAPTRRTWVVDAAAGNDRNPGTERAPLASIQAAHDLTRPGDTVLIRNGLYLETSPEAVVHIARSGLPGAPITYKAFPGHKPVLTARTAWNAVLVTASYIRVEGLEVAGAVDDIDIKDSEAAYERFIDPARRTWGPETSRVSSNGIAVRPINNNAPLAERLVPHHVEIVGNHVHHVPGGGIYTDIADHILIEGNLTHDCARRSIFANSGISLFHSFDVDADVTSYKNVIRNNVARHNRAEVKWYVTKKMSDGNGIIVDDLRNTQIKGQPYRGRTLVVNNVSHDNGGAGIQVFSADNVDLAYNTTANNSLTPGLNYGELWAHRTTRVRIVNNVAMASATSLLNDTDKNYDVAYAHNVWFGPNRPRVMGAGDVFADPLFENFEARDLRLQAGSPAVDSGFPAFGVTADLKGQQRPAGVRPDRGAFERQGR